MLTLTGTHRSSSPAHHSRSPRDSSHVGLDAFVPNSARKSPIAYKPDYSLMSSSAGKREKLHWTPFPARSTAEERKYYQQLQDAAKRLREFDRKHGKWGRGDPKLFRQRRQLLKQLGQPHGKYSRRFGERQKIHRGFLPGSQAMPWNSPRRLYKRLGKISSIQQAEDKKGTRLVRWGGQNGLTLTRMKTPNGRKLYLMTKEHGPHKKRVDSQLFFKGSGDTVIKKMRRQDGWVIQTTTARLEDLSKAAKKNGAKVKIKALKPALKSAEFRRFKEQVGARKINIKTIHQRVKDHNGKVKRQAVLVATTEDGHTPSGESPAR